MRRPHLTGLMASLLAMVLTGIPAATAQHLAPGGSFIDDDGNPHEPRIEAIAAQGITEGCNSTLELYCPEAPVTRGQMATFLARALGENLAAATQDWFTDDDGSVHEPNIDIIAENGITLGYGDGTFGPTDLVTRGQMASFLVRSLDGLAPATQDWFTDDDGSIHESDIDVIAENGITLGYGDGTFRPEANIARDEMATMLVRGLELDSITPPPRVAVSAYFYTLPTGEDPSGSGPFLVPVAREVAEPLAPAMPTVQALLSGPTSDESSGTPSIASEIPAGTEVLGLTIADGVATIDLSTEFQSGGGSFSMLGRVAQVVFTLTQFSTVDEVDFEIEGSPIDVLGGEGILLDSYDTRQEILVGTDMLPSIFVDFPAHGGTVDDPIRVIGWTGVFEAQFTVTITDGDGLIIAEQNVLAQGEQVTEPEGRTWTAFDFGIDYQVDDWQLGALIVFDTSAQDGSQIGVREYPILLKPTG